MSKASEQKERHKQYPLVNPKMFISAKDIKRWESMGKNKSPLLPKNTFQKNTSKKQVSKTTKSWFELEAQKQSSTIKYRAIRDEYGRILRTEQIL